MPEHLKVRISRVSKNVADIPLPSYATQGSSGMDVCAAVDHDQSIQPGGRVLVPSGFRIELPRGYEAQVRPRSGLAVNHGIGVLNAPGTIDSDYRGELKVVLVNFGQREFTIRRGDRIAQLVIAPVANAQWEEVVDIDSTTRGAGGFGHTGR